jgi:hypothetical protein
MGERAKIRLALTLHGDKTAARPITVRIAAV